METKNFFNIEAGDKVTMKPSGFLFDLRGVVISKTEARGHVFLLIQEISEAGSKIGKPEDWGPIPGSLQEYRDNQGALVKIQ